MNLEIGILLEMNERVLLQMNLVSKKGLPFFQETEPNLNERLSKTNERHAMHVMHVTL